MPTFPHTERQTAVVTLLAAGFLAGPAWAAPVPSRTAVDPLPVVWDSPRKVGLVRLRLEPALLGRPARLVVTPESRRRDVVTATAPSR